MRNFVVDGIRPAITSVTTTTPDGVYGQAATIDVTLNFTEPVSLTGGPIALNLNTGGTASILDFASSVTATGSYSVASPHTTPELNVSSITIGAAQLTDAAGNTAITVLPVSSNLVDTSTIVIDAIAPAIQSITSATPDATYGVGASIDVTVNFTENVILAGGTLEIVLDTGGTVSIPAFGPSTSASGTYTVGPMQTTGDLTVSPGGISLAGGPLADAAGNNADLAIPAGQNLGNNKAIAVDSDGGTVTSITSTATDGSYGDGQTIDVVLTFSEPVTLAGGNIQVSLDTGDIIAIGPFSNATTGVGTYTIASPDTSADLNVTGLSLDGGATLTDQYGNTTALVLPAGNNLTDTKNLVIDSTAPTIVSVTSTAASGTYGPAGPGIDITVTFSESVTMTGAGANMLVTLNSGHTLNYSSITSTTGETVTYTVLPGEDTGAADLSVTGISVAGGIIADAAGNQMVDFSIPLNLGTGIYIDGVAPVLTSITSSAANGTYGQGASIEVILTFSEGVILSGPITLHLDSGGTVTIPGFTGLSVVSDFYNVTVPQTSPDLNVTSIDLGSETIRDVAQNDTVMTLPAGNNLADNSNIVINAVAPTIQSILSATANGTYGTGSPIDVTINFSDNVALTGGNMELTLDSGGIVTITPFALSNTVSGTYTVAAGESSVDLTVTAINLIGATLQDVGGNNADLTLPAGQNLADMRDIVVDAYGGTVTSITSATPDGLYGPGQTIDVVLTFSEPVTLAGNDLILNLDTGYVLNVTPFTNSTIATGFYTIASNDASPDLNATSIGLLGGATIEDQYGNPTTLLLPSGNNLADLKALVVDGVAPTIAMINGTDSAYHEGQTVNFTVEFSEPVILSGGTIWLQLNTGGSAFVAPFGSSTTCTASYLIGAGENTNDLTVNNGGISLTGGTLMDAAGNTVDLTTPASNLAVNNDIVIDTTVPTIGSIYGTNGTFGNGQTVNFTVEFSEPVTLAGGTIQLGMDSGGTAIVSTCANSTTATASYTVGPGQNSPDLTVNIGTITLSAGTLTDAAGNGTDLTVPPSNLGVMSDIVIDTAAPSLASISSSMMGSYGLGSTIFMDVNFTEPVTLAGTLELILDTGDVVSVTGSYPTTMLSGSFTVGAGDNSPDLTVSSINLTGTLRDAALNDADTAIETGENLAENAGIVIDTTAPTISSITSSTANGWYNNMSSVDITVNMSEPVTLAGACNVQLDTGAIVSVSSAVYPATVLNGTYAIGAGENSPDLDATGVSIAGTLTDAAGNGADTTLPGSNLAMIKDIVIDTTPPEMTSFTSATADGSYRLGDVIDVTATFNEPVILSGGTLDVNFNTGGTGVISAFGPASVASGSYTVGAGANEGHLSENTWGFSGWLQDRAGNSINISMPPVTINSTRSIAIDTTDPYIASISSSTADGSYKEGDAIDVTVTFNEPVTLTGGPLDITFDTGNVVHIPAFGPSLTAIGTYTVGAGETSAHLSETTFGSSGPFVDAAGNTVLGTWPSTTISTGKNFIIDTTVPSISFVDSSTADGSYGLTSPVNVTVYFTEPVTLTGTMDLTLNSGGSVSVSSGAYPATELTGTYMVGPGQNAGDLSVTGITVTGTLQDAAKNDTTTTIPFLQNLHNNADIAIDTTPPTITSVTALDSTPGTYYNGGGPGTGYIIVRVNFSDAVSLTGGGSQHMDVALNSGKTLVFGAFGTTNTTCMNYSVEAGNTTGGVDLEASSIAVFNGQLVDQAGNQMTDFTIGSPVMTGFIVDGVGPTCSVSIGSNNGFGGGQYATGNDTITVIVDPDEPINQPTVTIAGASVTPSPDAGDTWKAVYLMPGGYTEGNIPYTVTSVTDTAGNVGTAVPDGSYVYYSDAEPTITQVYVNGANTLTNADVTAGTVSVQIDFSRQMYTLTNPSPTITGLTSSPYSITGSAWSNGDTRWTGTFALVDDNEDTTGTYNISGFQDIFGNTMTPTSAYTVAVDTQTPIGYIAINYLNKSQHGTVVDVAVQFDTAMNTSIPGTASLTIPSTASSYSLSSAGWTGNTLWTGQFTFNDVDDANIDATTGTFNVTGFEDTNGNVMDPLARNIIVDTMQPTVASVDSLTTDGTYGLGYGVDITVNFTEPVTMSGDNLTVRFADFPTTANLGQFPLATSIHATYTVASGDATASLNVYSPSGIDPGAGTLRDAAGNDANLAAFPPAGQNLADNTDIVIDAVQPMISYIWSSGAMSSYSAGQSVNVTLHFTESVNLNIGNLEIPLNSNGTAIATAPQSGVDISATYVVNAGDSTPLLDVNGSVTLTAGSLRDDAGNDANIITIPSMPNRLSDNDPISIDGSIPTIADVTADTTVDGAYGAGAAMDVTIHFSEQVSLTGGPITVNFDGGGSMQINDFTLSDTATGTYTVAASQNSADLYITGFSMGGAVIEDAAGNDADLTILPDNNLAFDRAIVIDTFAPTITSVTSSTAGGSYGNGQVIEISVNFSEPVTKVGGMPLYMDLNSGASAQHINTLSSQDTVSINYTIGTGDNTSPVYLAVTSLYVTTSTIQDSAGNQMTDFSIPINIDINLIVIDAVPPTINTASTMDTDNDGRIDHYMITFSEPVNDGTFPGYSANSLGTPQAIWSVAGYSNVVLAHGTASPSGADTPNDDVIYLKFDEMSFPDTGAKPDIQTTSAGAINDMTGNILDTIAMATVTEIDGVNPRIESIVGADGSDTIQVTFTEPVDATMGGGCSGTLSISNLTYQNASGADASAIINLSLDSNACDDQSVVIRTNTAVTTNDIDVDGLMPPASVIRDAADNAAMPNVYTLRGLTQSMQLSFDTTSAGANVTAAVSNFPLLVRLSDPGLIDIVRDGAPDIRFRDPDGTPLAYQIERWDKSLDAAEVWVLVPQIDGNSNTDYITMHFDDKSNDTVPGRQEPGKVFGTGNQFAGVWHMNEADGLTVVDSTANKNNSVARSTTRSANELIGGAQYFNNTNSIRIAHNTTLNGTSGSGMTISVWAKHYEGAMSENQAIVTKQSDTGSDYGYGFYTSTLDDYIYLRRDNTNFIYTNYTLLSDTIGTDWDYYVVRLNNSTTGSIYFNGTVQSLADNTISSLLTNTSDVYFGRFNNLTTYDTFQGSLDEIRIENTQRSAAWIKLCYENQRQDQTLIMEPWFDTSWLYRVKVTVPAANMTGTFNDFPLYIDLSKLPASFFTHVRSDGYDIRVTAGLQNLPVELVWINTTSGSEGGELYFRAPTVSSTKNMSFYIYYGNASASTDPTSTDVWSNGFNGVWHLQTSSGTVYDSTANSNDGILVNGIPADFIEGAIGNGYDCDGTNYIQIPPGSLNISGPLTMSAWTVLDATSMGLSEMPLMSTLDAASTIGYALAIYPASNTMEIRTHGGAPQTGYSSGSMSAAGTYYSACAIDAGTGFLMKSNGTTSSGTIGQPSIGSNEFYIGFTEYAMTNPYFNGIIDEVRVSSVARPADWMTNEYRNVNNSSFFTVGTEEAQ